MTTRATANVDVEELIGVVAIGGIDCPNGGGLSGGAYSPRCRRRGGHRLV